MMNAVLGGFSFRRYHNLPELYRCAFQSETRSKTWEESKRWFLKAASVVAFFRARYLDLSKPAKRGRKEIVELPVM